MACAGLTIGEPERGRKTSCVPDDEGADAPTDPEWNSSEHPRSEGSLERIEDAVVRRARMRDRHAILARLHLDHVRSKDNASNPELVVHRTRHLEVGDICLLERRSDVLSDLFNNWSRFHGSST